MAKRGRKPKVKTPESPKVESKFKLTLVFEGGQTYESAGETALEVFQNMKIENVYKAGQLTLLSENKQSTLLMGIMNLNILFGETFNEFRRKTKQTAFSNLLESSLLETSPNGE